jgi:hypothetical protein
MGIHADGWTTSGDVEEWDRRRRLLCVKGQVQCSWEGLHEWGAAAHRGVRLRTARRSRGGPSGTCHQAGHSAQRHGAICGVGAPRRSSGLCVHLRIARWSRGTAPGSGRLGGRSARSPAFQLAPWRMICGSPHSCRPSLGYLVLSAEPCPPGVRCPT